MKFLHLFLVFLCTLNIICTSITAQIITNVTNITNITNTTLNSEPQMRWESWVCAVVILLILLLLFFEVMNCASIMISASLFFHLIGIISTKELLDGLSNSGVVTIALLFIIVSPLTELPKVKQFIQCALNSQTCQEYLPRLKICSICISISWFVNNTPLVAMLTPIIKQFCREHNESPAQILMSVNIATLLGGTFSVIGTSTNLIVDGFMRNTDMGAMPFFEPIKVAGIPAMIGLIYLVILPKCLLSSTTGGLFRMMRENASTFLGQFVVLQQSILHKDEVQANQIETYLPLKFRSDVQLVEIIRKGKIMAPPNPVEKICSEDLLLFTGSVQNLNKMAYYLGLQWVPLTNLSAKIPRQLTKGELNDIIDLSRSSENFLEDSAEYLDNSINHTKDNSSDENKKTPEDKSISTSNSIQINEDEPNIEFIELVLSDYSPVIGEYVRTGIVQKIYSVSILALRSYQNNQDLTGSKLKNHQYKAGDTVLVIGSINIINHFKKHFYVISNCTNVQYDDPENKTYITIPNWCPCGVFLNEQSILPDINLQHNNTNNEPTDKLTDENANKNTQHNNQSSDQSDDGQDSDNDVKVIHIPEWYRYLSILMFIGMIVCAIIGFNIVICALCVASGLVLLKIIPFQKAIQLINYEVYFMVAFSLGLGSAVKNSGLANVIGHLVISSGVRGFPLLLLIATLSSIMSNIITNKVCAQVMFPIVHTIYSELDMDPMGGIMLLTVITSLAISTPYGFATNLIIMGPGGYTPSDFVKFGLPLNIIMIITMSIAAATVYDHW
jgi:di/tricarboxylate transporter